MTVYHGETVAPGVALGRVRLRGYGDEVTYPQRIPADEVQGELENLQRALVRSRAQLEELRTRHQDDLQESELRIFDVHVALLDDPTFSDSLETLVRQERYSVRAAIAKVVADYDRIFELVEDDYLRQRAGDFRDVAARVSGNLEQAEAVHRPISLPADGRFVLAARRLTVTDLFRLDDGKVEGIVTEAGGISSHAGILARSMGIPTITGISDLAGKLADDTFVVIDAGAGELHVSPDERLRVEYEAAAERLRATAVTPPADDAPHRTRDGVLVRLLGACGNLSEVELSRAFGMAGVGLYRTELMFLVEQRKPTEDVLVHHYRQMLRGGSEQPAWFRLLDVASNANVPWLHHRRERNPALGLRGVRGLLREGDGLRLQIRAILRAGAGHPEVGILVPFVSTVNELQRVRSAILEERQALTKRDIPCAGSVALAPVVEVPGSAFVTAALFAESDFVVVSLDDFQALLVAADRDNPDVRELYGIRHPAFFEMLNRMARDAAAAEKSLVLFGETAAIPELIPFYIGIGVRDFAVAPAHLGTVLSVVRRYTVDECRKVADELLAAPRALDVQRILLACAPEAETSRAARGPKARATTKRRSKSGGSGTRGTKAT